MHLISALITKTWYKVVQTKCQQIGLRSLLLNCKTDNRQCNRWGNRQYSRQQTSTDPILTICLSGTLYNHNFLKHHNRKTVLHPVCYETTFRTRDGEHHYAVFPIAYLHFGSAAACRSIVSAWSAARTPRPADGPLHSCCSQGRRDKSIRTITQLHKNTLCICLLSVMWLVQDTSKNLSSS